MQKLYKSYKLDVIKNLTRKSCGDDFKIAKCKRVKLNKSLADFANQSIG